jgi:hypothetical protein
LFAFGFESEIDGDLIELWAEAVLPDRIAPCVGTQASHSAKRHPFTMPQITFGLKPWPAILQALLIAQKIGPLT